MLQNFLASLQGLMVLGFVAGFLLGFSIRNWKLGCIPLLVVPVVMFFFSGLLFVPPSLAALCGYVIGHWLRSRLYRR